ncbi:MAG TPA: purine-nucleoside phosphorylase [Chloroflexota bacterium]|nr:purine-nucleoside phosphorylase [Chloroflexota bacterium]
MGGEAAFDPGEAARAVERGGVAPTVGLVLGSGLGELGERIEGAARTPFGAVPGMPSASVVGHAGELVVGRLGGQAVAAMRGRLHMYEGHPAHVVVRPVRLLHALGCTTLIVTNAAGGLNPAFRVGDLMAIVDHVFLPGLAGQNPLIGQPGERFVNMVGAYDAGLIDLAAAAARAAGFELRRGVYAMVSGPSFETPAELRLLRTVGADAVGMSTAPEVVVARQLGMRVLGVSCITNQANPDAPRPVDHEEVLAAGLAARERFAGLVTGVLAGL